MAVIVQTRTYFSQQHLEAGALCARQARAVEAAHVGQPSFISEHRTYVVGAVLFSVASLEATANELFADATDGTLSRLRPLDERVIARFREMWKAGVPRSARYPVLEKYSIALALADKDPLPHGEEPWQSAQSLVKLRNALVHYEPEWVPTETGKNPGEAHRFERELRGKFELNALTGEGNAFYPDKILGHGCAAWSVNTASAFIESFAKQLGLLSSLVGSRGIDLTTA